MLISILCPTRGRADWMVRLYDTAMATADNPSNIEFVYFIDRDDTESVERATKDLCKSNVRLLIRDRLPKEQYLNMWNICLENSSGEI